MPHGFAKVVIFKGKDDIVEGIWSVDKKKIVNYNYWLSYSALLSKNEKGRGNDKRFFLASNLKETYIFKYCFPRVIAKWTKCFDSLAQRAPFWCKLISIVPPTENVLL